MRREASSSCARGSRRAESLLLLARNQQDLVADFQGRPATYSENYPVPIHFSDDDAGRVFHA